MDRVSFEKQLAWMNPPGRGVKGRRIKAYDATLDINFYLKNLSGRQLSTAMLICLAYDGITCGWKKSAKVFPGDVHLLEINLMKLARSQRTSSN
jgi:hypothetical protein